MSKGKVKTYDAARGLGVIIDIVSGEQLTVYANYINLKVGESLQAAQDVEYEIESNRPRNWAVNVRIT